MIFKNYYRAILFFVFTCFSVQPQVAAGVQSFFNDHRGKLALGCAGGALVGGISFYAVGKTLTSLKEILDEMGKDEASLSSAQRAEREVIEKNIEWYEKVKIALLLGASLLAVAGILCTLQTDSSEGTDPVIEKSRVSLGEKTEDGDGDEGEGGDGGMGEGPPDAGPAVVVRLVSLAESTEEKPDDLVEPILIPEYFDLEEQHEGFDPQRLSPMQKSPRTPSFTHSSTFLIGTGGKE